MSGAQFIINNDQLQSRVAFVVGSATIELASGTVRLSSEATAPATVGGKFCNMRWK